MTCVPSCFPTKLAMPSLRTIHIAKAAITLASRRSLEGADVLIPGCTARPSVLNGEVADKDVGSGSIVEKSPIPLLARACRQMPC